jgi:hypothetical protein
MLVTRVTRTVTHPDQVAELQSGMAQYLSAPVSPCFGVQLGHLHPRLPLTCLKLAIGLGREEHWYLPLNRAFLAVLLRRLLHLAVYSVLFSYIQFCWPSTIPHSLKKQTVHRHGPS